MSKRICVEIDGVFYESLRYAGRIYNITYEIVKRRCLSDNYPNYRIVPFRITYTEKKCTKCENIKSLDEFAKENRHRDKVTSWCKQCVKQYISKYKKKHYPYNSERRKKYCKQKDVKDRRNKKLKEKRENNLVFKLNTDMATNIRKSLKDGKNGKHWEMFVDYTCTDLIKHLENLFLPEMSWENHGKGEGKWHIDHVIPKSLFNITSTKCKGFKACWALENLRPMWGKFNQEKSNNLFY